MRVTHWINQLGQGSLPACKSSAGNTKERAVGSAENGSTHDSSEAVPTAVKEDSCRPYRDHRQHSQKPVFKR